MKVTPKENIVDQIRASTCTMEISEEEAEPNTNPFFWWAGNAKFLAQLLEFPYY